MPLFFVLSSVLAELPAQKLKTIREVPADVKQFDMQSTNQFDSLPPGVVRGASVEGVTEYFLANGLQVLLFPDPSKQTITVNITYKVGSRHESYGETGMAHLLEHLVFKGTPRHPNIPAELTAHGARANGTTWFDRTNYFETFSATEENLRWALDLEADRMVNSFIAEKDLESEMTVVRNEFESGENNPFRILMQRVLSTAYLWHNYGNSTIGARADIEEVPIERLQAFYKKYYQPDNAVLMVAGKIDERKTIWMVHEYFSPIPKPDRYLYPTYTVEPVQDGERHVTLRRVGDIQLASACYHIPAGSHPDAAACELLVSILTNEPSGRLYKALVETKKAASVGGFCFILKEPGVAYLYTEIRKESSFEAANKVFLQTLDNFASQAPTAEELERARNKKLKDLELMFRNTEQVGTVVSEYIGMGDWRLGYIYRDNIKKVTVEDLRRVASAYFKVSNRTTGRFIPESKPDRAEIPSAPDVSALVKDYKGEGPIAQGEEFDPSPANIESRTHRYHSAKGKFQCAFLPKLTKGNVVNASIALRLGSLESLKGKKEISKFTAGMLDQGTVSRSKQQIKDELDILKARVTISGSGANVNVSIQSTREHFPAVMKLVADMLKNPAFREKEFLELKESVLASLEQNRSEPQALARMALQRHLSPYAKDDVRYVKTIEEEIAHSKAVKLEDCKKFHKQFYGATNATIAVVGDFDEIQVREIIETEFGHWKSKLPYQYISDQYREVEPINETIETPDKANAAFMAAMNLNLRDDDADYPALLVANYILGGGFLNSRLAVRIRQKEGLSYGVGSQLMVDSKDPRAVLWSFAIYAPENREKLETAFREELDRFVRHGINTQELEEAVKGLLQSRKVQRSQDPFLSNMLNNMLDLGRTFAFIEALENKMQSLTAEQVNAAIKRHVIPSKFSIVKAGDFANKIK